MTLPVKKQRSRKFYGIHHEYEGGFKPGNIVVVTSKTTFEGEAIGAVIPPQKWSENGIPVFIQHPRIKYVCIIPSREGDSIKLATRKSD